MSFLLARNFLIRDTRAVAAVEFAFVLPVLLLLIFGGFEISRLVLIQQKVLASGFEIASLISQYNRNTTSAAQGEISEAELTANVFPILSRLMSPYDGAAKQAIIITSLERAGSENWNIAWQRAQAGITPNCDGRGVCAVSIVNGLTPQAINAAGIALRDTNAAFPQSIQNTLQGYPTPAPWQYQYLIVAEVFYFYEPLYASLPGGSPNTSKIFVSRSYFVPRNGGLTALPPVFPCRNPFGGTCS